MQTWKKSLRPLISRSLRRSIPSSSSLQLVDPLADEPAVDFQLLLARTARADGADRAGSAGAARRPGHRVQVRPHPRQAGVSIFQLGQFHLQLGLLGLCPGRENIEDQLAAVHHLGLDHLLQLADLGRRQVVVKDDDIRLIASDPLSKLKDLALADVGGRIDFADFLLKPVNDNRPGTLGQGGQFRQVIPSIRARQMCGHQDGPLFSDF